MSAKSRQPCQPLVQPRIVLHRARPERIEGAVDPHILLGQPGVVANHLRFAQPGQADRAGARQAAEVSVIDRCIGDVDTGAAGIALFEDQGLFLL